MVEILVRMNYKNALIIVLAIVFSGSLIGNFWYAQSLNKAHILINYQETEISTLNVQVLNLTSQVDNLTESIILLETEKDNLEDEITNMINQINNLTTQILDLDNQIDSYNSQVTDLNNYIESLEATDLDGRVDLHIFDQIETILEGGGNIWNYGTKTAYNVKVKIYLYSGETEVFSKTFDVGTVEGRSWTSFNFIFGFEGYWDNWSFSIIY